MTSNDGPPAMTDAMTDLQNLLDLALQRHRDGALAEAEALYRQVLAAAPGHPDVLHLLGLAVARAGRHGEALDLLDQALARQPESATIRRNLAVALCGHGARLGQDGRPDAAAAAYRRALDLQPDLAEAADALRRLEQAAAPATAPATVPAAVRTGTPVDLTIAIPTWNRARFLETCLGHFTTQIRQGGFEGVTVLVSDNASEDDTPAVVERVRAEHPFVHYHRNPANLGFGRNLYRLLEMTTSGHVWLFGDDDVPAPGALGMIGRHLAELDVSVLCFAKTATAGGGLVGTGEVIAGTMLELCNSYGFLGLTSLISSLVLRTAGLKALPDASRELYLTNPFPHSCLALEAYAHDRAAIVSGLILDMAASKADKNVDQRWTREGIHRQYFALIDAIEHMVRTGALRDELTREFFTYPIGTGNIHLWDLLACWAIQMTLNSQNQVAPLFGKIEGYLKFIPNRQERKQVAERLRRAAQESRSYARQRQRLLGMAAELNHHNPVLKTALAQYEW